MSIEGDIRHKKILLEFSLKTAEREPQGSSLRDLMLAQSLRIEQEIFALERQVEKPVTRQEPKDPSIPTVNLTFEMGSKPTPPKKSARKPSKKISKATKKKVSGSRKRAF